MMESISFIQIFLLLYKIKLYIYDISIVLLEDGIEPIYGVTMYDRTNDEKEKSILKGYKDKYLSLI